MKRMRASLTVEASFVSIFCILLIFSIIVLAMCLRSRVSATANVRLEIENEFSNVMTERTLEKSFSKTKEYDGARFWPDAIFYYEESASRTYVRAPDIMYIDRIAEGILN